MMTMFFISFLTRRKKKGIVRIAAKQRNNVGQLWAGFGINSFCPSQYNS